MSAREKRYRRTPSKVLEGSEFGFKAMAIKIMRTKK